MPTISPSVLPVLMLFYLQCLHDLRLVRPSEVQRELAAAHRPGELGHRVLRILAGGAGQSLRQRGVYGGAAQDPAGGDHADRVRRILGLVFEGTAGVESWAGVCLDRGRRVFYFSQMDLTVGERASRRRAAPHLVVIPARADIQYAAASRFHHRRAGILGHPLSRVMTLLLGAGDLRHHFAAGDVSTIRPAGLPVRGRSAPSPRVPVAIRSDAASRIAAVSAAVTITTGVFIVTLSRCHHRTLSRRNYECLGSEWLGKTILVKPEPASPC